MSDLDLLLVNPGNRSSTYGKLGPTLAGIEPPLWCGMTASFIRDHGYSVKIIDADAQGWSPEYTAKQIASYNPLLVNIVVMGTNPSASSTPKMPAVSELLTEIHNIAPGLKTVLSGIHPSALPERTLKEEKVNFICQGEAFYTILNLLKALKEDIYLDTKKIKGLWYMKNGEIIAGGRGELMENLDDLPPVAWDLLPMDRYRAHNWHCFDNISERSPYAAIYTSLGCPFNCTYCNISAMYDGEPGIRYFSPEHVVKEIGILVKNYMVKNLKIADELFVLNEKRVNSICELIIEKGYKLNIWVYARVDTVNEAMLKKMKQAGVSWICYGIEAANKDVREGVSKKITEEKIIKSVKMTKYAGINVIGNFLFGLPDDNMKTMKETLELAKRLNCEYANFYATMAYPGSKLYEYAPEKDIKLPENWLGYGQLSEDTLPLPTKYLSAGEVIWFRDKAFENYYSNTDYLNMIEQKFGSHVVEHIRDMLKYRLRRKHAIEGKDIL